MGGKLSLPEAITRITHYLNTFKKLNETEHQWILDNAMICEYPKGTILLKAGEGQNLVWFNLNGLLKYYYIDYTGKERVKYFCTENRFALSIGSLLENKKSLFSLRL